MNVLRFASEIYEEEVIKYPILKQHEKIIYTATVLHDMCDKKYMDQAEGIREIEVFLREKMTAVDINVIKFIISTISYSYVKANGFPILGPYKSAYHIVREADLLSAYDFDRCLIYGLHKRNDDLESAYTEASKIFSDRVMKHNEHGLFVTDYSKQKSLSLETGALKQMDTWKRLLKNPSLR
jgi:hypothetical protein